MRKQVKGCLWTTGKSITDAFYFQIRRTLYDEQFDFFPFKLEGTAVFRRNIREAAFHSRVSAVLCVGYEENECYKEIQAAIPKVERESNKEIYLILQERLGDRRPGKGDGMNTALKYFLEETEHERLHFYDSDIEASPRSGSRRPSCRQITATRWSGTTFPVPPPTSWSPG